MSKPFSVVFLTSWYPTQEYPTHGIFIRNHAIALSKYCKIIVLYVYSSDEIQELCFEHTQTNALNEYVLAFPKSRTPLLKTFIHFFKYLYYYYKLARLAKKHFSDSTLLAQINVVYPVALFYPIVRKVLRIKKYAVFEQWTGYLKEDNLYKGFLRKIVTQVTIKNASKIWCLCTQQKNAMLHHHLKGEYEILGNVVNTDVFKPVPKVRHEKAMFLHVSTLEERQKNISGILRVFAELEQQGYEFDLVIIGGKNELLENARNAAKKLNLKQVSFKGILEQEKLVYYYQQADALVMFSNYETFCVAVYEALSCGTYVISTDVADLRKTIQETFGETIPVGDEQALKCSLVKIINSSQPLFSEQAHKWVRENVSELVIGKKLYDFYQSLNSNL